MIDPVPILIIAGLITLNAIYVAAEFAIVAVRRPALEEQVAAGKARADRVARTLRDQILQDRYIATAQLGITLASLGLGMYGETVLAANISRAFAGWGLPAWLVSHAAAGLIAIMLLTYLHIVLGEMIPKAIALVHPERAAMWLSPVVFATQIATYPLVMGLNGIGNRLLQGLRLPRQGSERYHTAQELQYIVRESEESGLLRPQAADVMEELLEFGQLTAGEVMVPRVKIHGVEFGGMLPDLRETIRAAPHTRYPVFVGDLDHIVGTIHIKDVLRRTRQGRIVAQSDIHPVPFIPETSTLDKVLAAMRQWRTQMAVVMDEHGGTAGLVTIEDLFEEVVGDIDEAITDQPPDLFRNEDGTLRAAGTVRVDEVGEELERELEHEDVDTVSGLVLALLDRPPVVGDVVSYEGVRFEVLAVAGHGVDECKISLLEPEIPIADEVPENQTSNRHGTAGRGTS
jgi:CBS domain containing-hemolysin-like protein